LSDTSELLFGITLVFITVGSMAICLPRNGKTAWFVHKPFLAPAVSVLIITGLALGLILLAAYFTTIDDATLSGAVKKF
jgi:hypothetical protein